MPEILKHDYRIPPQLKLNSYLGEGQRCHAYAGQYEGQPVAVKFYKPDYIAKYRDRYKCPIELFEHDRNLAFYSVDELRPYTVQPIATLCGKDGYSAAFVQEYVEGEVLRDLMMRIGHLPPEILESGRYIVDTAKAAGLHDLDMNDRNIKVQETENGWRPIVYDFNMMPQHMHAPNPLRALALKWGLRDKSKRDYLCLERWAFLGRHGGDDP